MYMIHIVQWMYILMILLMTFSHPYLSICADPLDVVSLQVYLSFKRNTKHLVFATPHGITEFTSHWLAQLEEQVGPCTCYHQIGPQWPCRCHQSWGHSSVPELLICDRDDKPRVRAWKACKQTISQAHVKNMYRVCTWYIHILMCHIRTSKAHTRSGHAHTHTCTCRHASVCISI